SPSGLGIAEATASTLHLSWTPILYTANGGGYVISYGLAAEGPFTVAGMTADRQVDHYALTGLFDHTIYYVRVRTYTPPHSAHSNAVWSDYTTVVGQTAGSLSNAAPGINRYTTLTPTLTWGSITWATGYEVQVSNLPNFSVLSSTTTTDANTLAYTTTSLANGTYYWRVRAQRANGSWSGWSAVDSFVIRP